MAIDFTEIDLGHELAPLTLTPTSQQIRSYAIAAHMPGGRFMSDEAAQREGLPGQIIPGNFSIALFSRLLAQALPGATMLKLSATFRAMIRPGTALVVHGVVTEKHCTDHGDEVECDLVVESSDGDRFVTGTARLRLPA